MKYLFFSLAMLVMVNSGKAQSSTSATKAESKLGWKISSVSYCWKEFTFFEALDKLDSCGLKYIEGWANHTIGGGLEGKLDYHMNAETRKQVLQRLKSKGIKMLAYGVITPNNETDWKLLFEFCKNMGVEIIDSEPELKFLPLVSKLCDQYKIDLAIHNHASPSTYWNPDVLLEAIKGQSKRIGSCADIAHWVQSGLDPVECLKKLEGHLLHSHMSDLNEKNNKKAHSVPWGTGVLDMPGIFAEFKRQQFRGLIEIEYEYNWFNNVPDIKASVGYFRNELNNLTSK
jgi:sugar phosphate isomerase/epimerase